MEGEEREECSSLSWMGLATWLICAKGLFDLQGRERRAVREIQE